MSRVGRNASGGVQVTSGEGLLETMSEAIDPVGLMQRVADQTVELIPGADGVMIGLADRQGVSFVWGAGVNASHVGTRVNLDSSLSGLAIRRRQMLWCHDSETDPRVDKEVCRRNSVGSAVCIPLIRERETLGVLATSDPVPMRSPKRMSPASSTWPTPSSSPSVSRVNSRA
ncbi:MAG: two-component system, sensor histidine kinase [Actinomycetota bacterium]|jgi:GAF domain-containing protein|nr:two-component system, sensor histidine kinase [Actinomycetota bacterium]